MHDPSSRPMSFMATSAHPRASCTQSALAGSARAAGTGTGTRPDGRPRHTGRRKGRAYPGARRFADLLGADAPPAKVTTTPPASAAPVPFEGRPPSERTPVRRLLGKL